MGYKTAPLFNDKRADIVQLIYFNNEEELCEYARAIQASGAIDSNSRPCLFDRVSKECYYNQGTGEFLYG